MAYNKFSGDDFIEDSTISDKKLIPLSGSGNPRGSVTPERKNQIYLDTDTDEHYISTGVANTNWLKITTVATSALVDSNTIVFWDFNSNLVGGDETGETGSGQGGDLSLTESGSVAAAIDTSPISGFLDDGFYRQLDATNDYFSANQIYTSGLNQWTYEIVFKTRSTLGTDDFVMSHQVGGSGTARAGLMMGIGTTWTNNGVAIITNSAGTLILQVTAPATILTSTWYHAVLKKNGDDYSASMSTSMITNSSEFNSNQWGSTATVSGDFTPAQLLLLGARQNLGTPDRLDSQFDFGWARISNIARY